jgi:hypothetical protein
MESHPSFFLGLHLRFVSLTLASPWVEAFIEQATAFPNGRNEDQPRIAHPVALPSSPCSWT